MKMHFKPILWLVGGIIVMFAASLTLELYRNTAALRKLSAENLTLLEEREQKNAENVFLTTENAVAGSLERGEMEKFIRLLKAQKSVRGLMEFSLFSSQGVVTHSSDPVFLNKTLPAELRTQLLTGLEKVTRRTNDCFELYHPQRVQADCLRCHLKWREGDAGGVLFCRFSTESLTQAQQQWAKSLTGMKRSQIVNGVATALVIAAIFGTLAVFVVRYQIAAPLVRVLERLTETSDQLRATSNQLTESGQSLADGASHQAASLEETSASLEELSTMIKNNADNAQTANDLANQARSAAESGSTGMTQMNQAMNDIQSASSNIAKIIKTIDEIAFQTNLLALNAAVEAARAGEAGMGFAVVADEVRSLAQRSAQAAKETAGKIEDSIQKSQKGVRISGEVARSFEEIKDKVRTVDELITRIATASREQSLGISQVNTAVRDVDVITQTNAANAEQSASAAVDVHAQAESLRGAIGELMHLMSGNADPSQPGGTPAPDHHASSTRVSKTTAALPVRPGRKLTVAPAQSKAASHEETEAVAAVEDGA
jgi:methyl-accepting chemotaxis protein